ncbi:MAG: glycogen synthase GlgA [Pseudomonadota bacterium]|nr:glycogen synthase GlgA [Pseudomonadota bacterium]
MMNPSVPVEASTRLRVLHAAVECMPFATTGGLGDVLAALPGAQCGLGMDARIILPRYGFLDERIACGTVVAEVEALGRRAQIIESPVTANGAPIYWCDIPDLFGHCADPYRRADGQELEDLALRFAAFSEAVARFVCQSGVFAPQVVHVHDWHTALVSAWLKQLGSGARSILSIHNLAFQGQFDDTILQRCGFPAIARNEVSAESGGSFLRAGVVFSDATSTVSPSYAREIQQAEQGFGLDGLLRTLAEDGRLTGIVNGIDERSWDPQTDASLVRNYSIADVDAGKSANRTALATELRLDESDAPVIAFVGRLTSQKGADLIAEAGPALLSTQARYVLVGVGEPELTQRLQAFQATAPDRVAFCNRYDPDLVRRVLAGADLLLMPSRFEPCGMLQMYAQRYGAIPVVRATGGLIDTVVDATPETLSAGSASGVQFIDADAAGLVYGVRRGLDLLGDTAARQGLQACGMNRSFSWSSTAADYRRLYMQGAATTA